MPEVPPAAHDEHGVAHERSDIGVRGVLLTGAAFAGAVVVLISVVFLLVTWLHDADQAARTTLTAVERTELIPPAPRLQATPETDMRLLRAREARALESYGWADPGRTRARIPLEEARRLMVGRPLDRPPP